MELIIILILILLNGIFAMAEIAMVSARKIRLESSARKGNRAAKKALELSKQPAKFLSAVQIGITLIGILTGIYSGEKLEDDLQLYLEQIPIFRLYSETLSIGIIVVVLTFFSLLLGELIPKRIGLANPETVSKVLSYPMHFISVVAAPFIWLLTKSSDLIIRLFKIKKSGDNVTEEDIRAMIREGRESGEVQGIEQEIVENVFHLGDRKIRSLMTLRSNIEWIHADDTAAEIEAVIRESDHSYFPVAGDDPENVLGIVKAKDVLNARLAKNNFSISELIKPAFYLSDNTSAYRALEKIGNAKHPLAIVVDEFGVVQGLLTMNDLMDALIGDLKQQLHEREEVIPRGDDTYLIDAALPIPEFLRYFELENDPSIEQINTLGGLAYHFGSKMPRSGDKFTWKNFLFEIVDMDGRRIDKILVKVIKESPL